MSAYETVINHSSSSSSSSSEEEVDIDAKLRKIEKLKKRMEEMEAEAASIRQLTNNLERETEAARTAAMLTSRAEADSRSVFVGNVDYACTPEEVQQHFQACGIVNRLTIPTNRFGQPQGYAYIEFIDSEAVEEALQLNESELHGRPLKELLSSGPTFLGIPQISEERASEGPFVICLTNGKESSNRNREYTLSNIFDAPYILFQCILSVVGFSG